MLEAPDTFLYTILTNLRHYFSMIKSLMDLKLNCDDS